MRALVVSLAVLPGCAWVSDADVIEKVAQVDGDLDTDAGDDTASDGGDDTSSDGDDTGDCESVTWFRDGDGDGFGDPGTTEDACEAPSGFIADAGDCDDARADVNPDADDPCSDGLDQDCAGDDDACALSGAGIVDDLAIASFSGEQNEGFGWSAGTTGDLDGDGRPEIVGTTALQNGTTTGGAWVFPPSLDLATAGPVTPATAGAVFIEDDEEYLGLSVTPVLPSDGDSFGGVVLSAGRLQSGPDDFRWELYEGPWDGSGPVPHTATLSTDFSTLSALNQAHAHSADADGDGVADLLMAGIAEEDGETFGRSWFVLGPITGDVDLEDDIRARFSSTYGTPERDEGISSRLCDLDADGMAEILHGSPGYPDGDEASGTVFYWDELPGEMAQTTFVNAPHRFGTSSESLRSLGFRIRCGDLTGDGRADLAVYARVDQLRGVVVIDGAAVDGAGAVIEVAEHPLVGPGLDLSYERLLPRFDAVPDMTGNGVDELALSYHYRESTTGAGDATGEVYLFNGPLPDGNLTLDVADAVITGDAAERRLGIGVSGVPDVDGDGLGELLLVGNVEFADDRGGFFLLPGGR